MRAQGYEIKGETFEKGAAKYISFRPLDKKRKEVCEIKRKQENLNQYLGRTQPSPAQEQQEKKDTPHL